MAALRQKRSYPAIASRAVDASDAPGRGPSILGGFAPATGCQEILHTAKMGKLRRGLRNGTDLPSCLCHAP